MQAATRAIQRPRDAKLLVIDESQGQIHAPRTAFTDFLSAGDLVIANDAATLPASLHGVHQPTSEPIEVRLAGRASLRSDDLRFTAIAFGRGDFHTRTEERPLPPTLHRGDRLLLGSLVATIEAVLDHPRLVSLVFAGEPHAIWAGLATDGRPIQYAHVPEALELWDVWTPFASVPAAFEPPSAGFALDWSQLRRMHARGIQFATITHAAGISSTGDERLDARLPFHRVHVLNFNPEGICAVLTRYGAICGISSNSTFIATDFAGMVEPNCKGCGRARCHLPRR